MSTLTKEWLLKTIAELEEEHDATPGAVNEDAANALAAMKLALVSLEAEAVGEVVLGEYDDCGCHPDAKVVCIAADGQADWENFKDGTRLYTAPPALASVPDDYFSSLVAAARVQADKAMRKFPQPNYVLNKVAEESGEVIKAVIHFTEGREEWRNVEGEIIDNLAMLIRLVMEGDQVIGFTPPAACRAAMLQGAAENSPVIPDGVCPCCGRKPLKNRACSVSGCDGKHVARGFCAMHYAIERKKDPSRRESIRAADKRYRARKAAAPQQEADNE